MSLWDRARTWWTTRGSSNPRAALIPAPVDLLADLPLRRTEATAAVVAATAIVEEAYLAPAGALIDNDDWQYRRVAGGQRFLTRDLHPIAQEKMLQIAWWLIESNPLAKRLIGLMTDLVIGEGVQPTAKDEDLADILTRTWTHPVNRLGERLRSLYTALRLNGELILPVARNPVSGIPVLGYLDPLQLARPVVDPDNALEIDALVLKSTAGAAEGARLQVVRENPETGKLEGDVFYFRVNSLPNASRGRSDLLALADWIDMHAQQMWAHVEGSKLRSAFVYDLLMKKASPQEVADRQANFPVPAPGSVYVHNENEELAVKTPALNNTDHAEGLKALATFIAGAMGFPITWLGFDGGNRATIEGQADVLLKTPKAMQAEFAGFLRQILRYAVEGVVAANPGLYRGLDKERFSVELPEIATKDIARVGGVLASVVSALDSAIANGTMSTQTAMGIQLNILRHFGTDVELGELQAEIAAERAEQQAAADATQAATARARAATRPPLPPVAAPPEDVAV